MHSKMGILQIHYINILFMFIFRDVTSILRIDYIVSKGLLVPVLAENICEHKRRKNQWLVTKE